MGIVEDGGPRLARALAKIVTYTGNMKSRGMDTSRYSGFKALFIADPDRSLQELNELKNHGIVNDIVVELARKKITTGEKILELLSTHPNTTKRIRRLLGIN
jgi:heat shock protein HtpX